MEISGLVKSSLIDYPGKVAAVVFTQGCNFRCGFCHNPDLLPQRKGTFPEKEVLLYLEKRKNIIDGVVITGGEPLIQPDLREFILKVKELGMLVKLDTNGSSPDLLKDYLDNGLVDYVAMDIKGPLKKYHKISRYKNTKFIQQSIEIIRKSGADYEFRTTVLPYYHDESDFLEIGIMLKGVKKYVLQGFRPALTFDKSLADERPFGIIEINKIADIMNKYVENVVIHDNLS